MISLINKKSSRFFGTNALVLLLFQSACAAPDAQQAGSGLIGQVEGRWRQQDHKVPMMDQDGTPRLLHTRVCHPESDKIARILVYAHGTGSNRQALDARDCDSEAILWFLRRGFMVVQPLRRGYGATGGRQSEVLDVVPGGLKTCNNLNPASIALEAARDVAAAVDYATALPGAHPDNAVVLGNSTGGYISVAFNSRSHPKVSAVINISGGIAGRFSGDVGQVCDAERMVDGARTFGATAVSPMLWLYTSNDLYFPPDLGQAMFDAYTGAGGKGQFVELGPYASNGHFIFSGRGGSRLWGPPLERYLEQQGISKSAPQGGSK